MAPGVRRGHSGDRGGRVSRRRDAAAAAADGRRSAPAAGMLPLAGLMLLLVRGTSAADEKSTYDASGSSYLPSEPTVTTARPSLGQSSSDVVPFSVNRSDGDSGSEREGLSGQPAFSSVLTVIAGTIKAPVSPTDNRTSPTITRGDTLTTQWPSHSYSQESQTSILSGATGSLAESTGQPRHYTASAALTSSSTSAVSDNMKVAILSLWLPPLPSPSSSSTPNQLSFHGKNLASDTDSQAGRNTHAPDTFLGFNGTPKPVKNTALTALNPKKHLKATQSTVNVPAWAFQPEGLSSKASNEELHESTSYLENEEYNSGDGTYSSGLLIRRKNIKYQVSFRDTQTQGSDYNGASGTSFPFNQGSQAVERLLGDRRNPESADAKSSSASGHGSERMLNLITYMGNKTAENGLTSFHENAIKPSLQSHVGSSTAPTLFTVTPLRRIGDASLSATTIDSGTVFLGLATNPGDLPMAAGHSGPSAPDTDINYSQRKMAGAELKSISSEAHPNIFPSLTSHSSGSRTNSLLRFITRHGSTVSMADTGSAHFTGDEVINEARSVTQPGIPASRTQKQDDEEQESLNTAPSVPGSDTISGVVPFQGNYPYPTTTSLMTPLLQSFQTISTPFRRKVHSLDQIPPKKQTSPGEIGSDQAGRFKTPVSSSTSASSSISDGASSTPAALFDKRGPPGPAFLVAEDVFKSRRSAATSSKVAPAVTFDAGAEILKGRPRKNGATHGDSSEPLHSSRPEITQKTRYFPHSLAPITGSGKSRFYSDSRAIMRTTISSAAAEQKGAERLSAIYSVGSGLMAPYTKWNASKPDSFQSSVFALQKQSDGFHTTFSDFQAGGPVYEDLKLEDGQMPNLVIANSGESKVTVDGGVRRTAESNLVSDTTRADIMPPELDLGDEQSLNDKSALVSNTPSLMSFTSGSAIQPAVDETLSSNNREISAGTSAMPSSSVQNLPTFSNNDVRTSVPTSVKPYLSLPVSLLTRLPFAVHQDASRTRFVSTDGLKHATSALRSHLQLSDTSSLSHALTDVISQSAFPVSSPLAKAVNLSTLPTSPGTLDSFLDTSVITTSASLPGQLSAAGFISDVLSSDSYQYQAETAADGPDNADQPSITLADAAQSGFDSTDTLSNTLMPAFKGLSSLSIGYLSTSGDIKAVDLVSSDTHLTTSLVAQRQDSSVSSYLVSFSTPSAISLESSSFQVISEPQRFDLSPSASASQRPDVTLDLDGIKNQSDGSSTDFRATVSNQLNVAESDVLSAFTAANNAVLNGATSSSFPAFSDVTAMDFTSSDAASPLPLLTRSLGPNNPTLHPLISDFTDSSETSTMSVFIKPTSNSELVSPSKRSDEATASDADALPYLSGTDSTILVSESMNRLSSTHAELYSAGTLTNSLAPEQGMTSSTPLLSTFSNLVEMRHTASGAPSPSTSNSISSLKVHLAGSTASNEQSLRLISITSNLESLTDGFTKLSSAPARLVSASKLHAQQGTTFGSVQPAFSTDSPLSSTSSSSSSPSSSLPSSTSPPSLSLSSSMFHSTGTLPPHPTPSITAGPRFTSSPHPEHTQKVTATFFIPTALEQGELTTRTTRTIPLRLPKEKGSSLTPSLSAGATLSEAPTERTSQVSALTPYEDTTATSVMVTGTTVAPTTKTTNPSTGMPSLRATPETTRATTTTTTQPLPFTRRVTTTRRTFTPHIPRTISPRIGTTIFISPFTTTTESPPQQCNVTERMWLRTVVSIYVRRNRLDSIQRQNLRRGLTQGLRKALNDSSAQAQMETVFGSPNMTVAYHVTGADTVYPPSVVLDGLDAYGRDKLIADLRQYLPLVTALPIPVALWRPSPSTGYQLKTVLQFVGAGDDPRSCRFFQMMEQRLEKVFAEAQSRVLRTSSRLSVQMLSVTQGSSSPAVSLVYVVKNGTAFLNGTTASNLLGRLSAELVGYFLFYPPLIIAEPLEYHNLNTSIATRDYWVITVILDVEDASLEAQYQSFASLMEQRLAELFVWAGQHGTRFKRATSVESYTVQMVSIRRVSGLKNPAEMTYYIQHNGTPLLGTSAAKVLNTVDSQTMALTLGYFVQLQAEPVVKNPPNNLWIIAAVLAPIAVVTLIIIIITAVLCRKNKNDFKSDAIGNLNPRAKMAYRRDVGYYHQPVQGFDYAKQHLGQQGGDEETLPASQDTLMMSLQIRDKPLSLEKVLQQEGSVNKKSMGCDKKHKSKLPSDDGSVISNESERLNSSRGLTAPKVTAQQKPTKEEKHKRDDPYDSSSGSLQLVSIKPLMAQHNYLHPASSDRIYDSAIVNGEVNISLKQKSDADHYRNKLRIKGKRKGYYDFPVVDAGSGGHASSRREQNCYERVVCENSRGLEPEDERSSTYVKSNSRHSQVGQMAYRSRQSLSSPSPGGTEMDLLVMRERPRKGIRNSGYDTEPELIQETNVDRLVGQRGHMYGRGLKGHSETSTLSSQPSIDEVRQQMHLLLEEAFTLASGGQSTSGRHHNHHPRPDPYSQEPPPFPYADVVSSTPGTMSCGGLQWVPSYGSDVYSLPKPAFRFTQLPDMTMSPPPPLPPRSGPPPGKSLRRSTSDLGPKSRRSETAIVELQSQHDKNPYGLAKRATLSAISAEPPLTNYSGNPITAVYAIPASRTSYSDYVVSTPPTSYHSPSWMSYPPEPEDVTPQWADAVPLPGYVEAFPHPRYPQGSPPRLPLQYNQTLDQKHSSSTNQQNLKDMDGLNLSSLTTSALVQAIRQEVAKLAKKQNDMFEF